MVKHNNVIPNGHFKKHWQNYVKTWFNQPARKERRRIGGYIIFLHLGLPCFGPELCNTLIVHTCKHNPPSNFSAKYYCWVIFDWHMLNYHQLARRRLSKSSPALLLENSVLLYMDRHWSITWKWDLEGAFLWKNWRWGVVVIVC